MTNCIHSKDAAVFRRRQSFDVLFGALVHALGQAEVDGITDQSIDPDLGLYELDKHFRGVHPQFANCARSFHVIVESTNYFCVRSRC
jgi:hypothetical protein